MRLLPGLLALNVSAQGIPQYGPMRGYWCLSPEDDDTGKYTMKYSIESFNRIEEECRRLGKNTRGYNLQLPSSDFGNFSGIAYSF